jgi:hypothetical protein
MSSIEIQPASPIDHPNGAGSPISDYAIIVDGNDNVAVVKTETSPHLKVILRDGRMVQLRDAVPPGHRFATRDIPEGQFVLQFGQPIGTSL